MTKSLLYSLFPLEKHNNTPLLQLTSFRNFTFLLPGIITILLLRILIHTPARGVTASVITNYTPAEFQSTLPHGE